MATALIQIGRALTPSDGGGNGYIAADGSEIDPPSGDYALVTSDGSPVRRRVLVMHTRSRRIVATTISDAAGEFRIDGLSPDELFTVFALDHTGTYNAVIADRITPVPQA